MPRVDLLEQEDYAFTYAVTVQARHENSTGHVDHKAIIEIIHDARSHLFRSLGMREGNLGDGRTGVVMADLVVNYKRESFAFDNLCVSIECGDWSPKAFRMFFRVQRVDDEAVIALAESGLVAFDYEERRSTVIPRALREAIGSVAKTDVGSL